MQICTNWLFHRTNQKGTESQNIQLEHCGNLRPNIDVRERIEQEEIIKPASYNFISDVEELEIFTI